MNDVAIENKLAECPNCQKRSVPYSPVAVEPYTNPQVQIVKCQACNQQFRIEDWRYQVRNIFDWPVLTSVETRVICVICPNCLWNENIYQVDGRQQCENCGYHFASDEPGEEPEA
jgi:DNA-directed RNA polymerase subunit M/transcription elongation factor TFIIS